MLAHSVISERKIRQDLVFNDIHCTSSFYWPTLYHGMQRTFSMGSNSTKNFIDFTQTLLQWLSDWAHFRVSNTKETGYIYWPIKHGRIGNFQTGFITNYPHHTARSEVRFMPDAGSRRRKPTPWRAHHCYFGVIFYTAYTQCNGWFSAGTGIFKFPPDGPGCQLCGQGRVNHAWDF